MANTYHQVYIMFVFAVKYRQALLDKKWRQEVFGVMGQLFDECGSKTLIVNGVEDHVHCLVGFGKLMSQSDLLKVVKARSSKYINDNKLTEYKFEWQSGYASFSYSHSALNKIYKYIQNQEEHHRNQKFRDEYMALLKAYDLEYDEKFIFHEPMDYDGVG